MTKSKNKEVLRQIYPHIFTNDLIPGFDFNPDYVIEDGMIQLQSFRGNGITNPTGREVVKHMMANVSDHLSNSSCKAYVFMMDKIQFVYKTKGIEHKKRAMSRDVIPAPDPIEGQKLLPLDTAVPHRWDSIMANRKTRMALIEELAHLIIDLFHPPQGKILILEGALLDVPFSPVVIRSSPGNGDESILNHRECFWNFDGEVNLSDRTLNRPENLHNRVGECDECAVFYLDYLRRDHLEHRERTGMTAREDGVLIDVITRDTDFIPILLSHCKKMEEDGFRIRIRFKSMKKHMDYFDSKSEYMLVNELYKSLYEDKCISRPELSLSAVIMASGNDYVDGYVGITPETMISTFLEYVEYIGDLVDVDLNGRWKLDPASYVRFLKCCYFNKYKKQVEKFCVDLSMRKEASDLLAAEISEIEKKVGRGGKEEKRLKSKLLKTKIISEEEMRFLSQIHSEEVHAEDLSWDILIHVIKTRNPKNIKVHVPSMKAFWLRYLRLCMNLVILEVGHLSGPEIVDDVCTQYGYCLVDESLPISLHNIRRREETDPIEGIDVSFEEIHRS